MVGFKNGIIIFGLTHEAQKNKLHSYTIYECAVRCVKKRRDNIEI